MSPRRVTPRAKASTGDPRKKPTRPRAVHAVTDEDLAAVRARLDAAPAAAPPRWNADPEDVRRSVAKLVLALVELIRQLLERQAIRRMEAGTLSPEEIERVGLALMRLEETIHSLAEQFGLDPSELNLDLGPLGKLF